ncbi:MAG: hypothetical protein GF365_02400 [Candidatus Buchananbacteria bacterium]|nr:hypothetical protein [Candidatus Buchananbacteria bacterium]
MTQFARVKLLKVQVETLRKSELNLAAMQLIANTVFQALNMQETTWEELGTTKAEIDSLLNNQLKTEFLQLFQDYQSGSTDLDSLVGYFKEIQQKIMSAQLSFKDLDPFNCNDFFALQISLQNLEESGKA